MNDAAVIQRLRRKCNLVIFVSLGGCIWIQSEDRLYHLSPQCVAAVASAVSRNPPPQSMCAALEH